MGHGIDLSQGLDLGHLAGTGPDGMEPSYGELDEFLDHTRSTTGHVPTAKSNISPINMDSTMNRIERHWRQHKALGGERIEAVEYMAGDDLWDIQTEIQSVYGHGQLRSNKALKQNDCRLIMRCHQNAIPLLKLKLGFDVHDYDEDDVERVMKSDDPVAKAVRMDKY